jgi:hypothetical protein
MRAKPGKKPRQPVPGAELKEVLERMGRFRVASRNVSVVPVQLRWHFLNLKVLFLVHVAINETDGNSLEAAGSLDVSLNLQGLPGLEIRAPYAGSVR